VAEVLDRRALRQLDDGKVDRLRTACSVAVFWKPPKATGSRARPPPTSAITPPPRSYPVASIVVVNSTREVAVSTTRTSMETCDSV